MSDPIQTHELFSLLANPGRLELIRAIGRGEACVCHLEAVTGKRQAFISQHLMALRKAGLLESRKEGKFSYYQIIDPRLFEILNLGAEFTGDQKTKLPPDGQINCDCPKCQE